MGYYVSVIQCVQPFLPSHMTVVYDSLDVFSDATFVCTGSYVFDTGVDNVTSSCQFDKDLNEAKWSSFDERCICKYLYFIMFNL